MKSGNCLSKEDLGLKVSPSFQWHPYLAGVVLIKRSQNLSYHAVGVKKWFAKKSPFSSCQHAKIDTLKLEKI